MLKKAGYFLFLINNLNSYFCVKSVEKLTLKEMYKYF